MARPEGEGTRKASPMQGHKTCAGHKQGLYVLFSECFCRTCLTRLCFWATCIKAARICQTFRWPQISEDKWESTLMTLSDSCTKLTGIMYHSTHNSGGSIPLKNSGPLFKSRQSIIFTKYSNSSRFFLWVAKHYPRV